MLLEFLAYLFLTDMLLQFFRLIFKKFTIELWWTFGPSYLSN